MDSNPFRFFDGIARAMDIFGRVLEHPPTAGTHAFIREGEGCSVLTFSDDAPEGPPGFECALPPGFELTHQHTMFAGRFAMLRKRGDPVTIRSELEALGHAWADDAWYAALGVSRRPDANVIPLDGGATCIVRFDTEETTVLVQQAADLRAERVRDG